MYIPAYVSKRQTDCKATSSRRWAALWSSDAGPRAAVTRRRPAGTRRPRCGAGWAGQYCPGTRKRLMNLIPWRGHLPPRHPQQVGLKATEITKLILNMIPNAVYSSTPNVIASMIPNMVPDMVSYLIQNLWLSKLFSTICPTKYFPNMVP